MASARQIKWRSDTALTITLASLASSTAGVGRQSTTVANSNNDPYLLIYGKITTGTSPTANRSIRVYLIRRATSSYGTDVAGASDAAWTVVAATPVVYIPTINTSDKLYHIPPTVIEFPGPEFGIGVVHDTGVNLNSTGGNHDIRYQFGYDEMQ